MPRRRKPRSKLLALTLAVGALLLSGALRPQWHLDAVLWVQRTAAGAEVLRVAVAGSRWVYLHAGDDSAANPPIVLVHGFTGSKENWLPVIGSLSRSRRVIAPDLAGWGGSEREAGGDYGYAAQAERLSSFLHALELPPVDLIGHSMGGGIAAVMAARHPEQVRRLVLMDASGVRFRDNAFGAAVLDGQNPFAVTDTASLHRYLATVFLSPPFVPWPIDRALVQRRIGDVAFEQSVLDSIARGDEAFLPGRLAEQIATDTLLLWCRNDGVVDPSAAEIWAAGLPSSQIDWLDECNHMPMMEKPKETVRSLNAFLVEH